MYSYNPHFPSQCTIACEMGISVELDISVLLKERPTLSKLGNTPLTDWLQNA